LFEQSESGKLQQLETLAAQIAMKHEKVLVFTQFREMTSVLHDLLARVFGRPGAILHGGTPVGERAKLVEAFQRPGGVPFFVLSLKAAGTGLTLTAANHVIHFDRWWNPAVENQATDRAYRIGQHQNVMVHKFLCAGTIESRIDRMLRRKQNVANALFEPGEGAHAFTEWSDEELFELTRLENCNE
jgi:non-specific serine/threonine protein kinase